MPVDARMMQAFATRADGVRPEGRALVGLFGEGLPRALPAALGALAVDVKAPPLSDAADGPVARVVRTVAEPFLDRYTERFLHRFAAGAFDHFASLIFARGDVAALAAYQYALEMRRQGMVPEGGPRLHLWNLLHDTRPAAARYNAGELARLVAHLAETLGSEPDAERLEAAVGAEADRQRHLQALPPGGAEAFVARNAARWMTPEAHCAALGEVPPGRGPKIALVGTACDVPVLHELCAPFGQVVADLQDYGRCPPQPARAEDLLGEIVRDPLAPRTIPPAGFTGALEAGIAGADLVIASVDRNDDSFGWELPGLKRAAEATGARFLDLGFRPFTPDCAWQEAARDRIAEVLA